MFKMYFVEPDDKVETKSQDYIHELTLKQSLEHFLWVPEACLLQKNEQINKYGGTSHVRIVIIEDLLLAA